MGIIKILKITSATILMTVVLLASSICAQSNDEILTMTQRAISIRADMVKQMANDIDFAENVSKIQENLYHSLIRKGFTKKEALELTKSATNGIIGM